MKLTTKSEYSLLALIFMARNQEKGWVKIRDICGHYAMPKKYLEQLLIILKRNRYIRAKRGAGGGYMLALKPEEISFAQIVRLMDGPLAPTDSASKYFYSRTPIEKERKVLDVFKGIRDYIAAKMENTFLSDFL